MKSFATTPRPVPAKPDTPPKEPITARKLDPRSVAQPIVKKK